MVISMSINICNNGLKFEMLFVIVSMYKRDVQRDIKIICKNVYVGV